jgi:hypothetical protein
MTLNRSQVNPTQQIAVFQSLSNPEHFMRETRTCRMGLLLHSVVGLLGLDLLLRGTVRGGGGIGKIGEQTNPENPNGRWTLDQWTSNYSLQNKVYVVIDNREQKGGPAWRDINLEGYDSAPRNSENFSRYDFPSLNAKRDPHGTFKNQNFFIKVYNGKKYCEAAFHIVQRGTTIHWGRGAIGN